MDPDHPGAGAQTLSERLEGALTRQRAEFDALVEEGALQLACAAHQELLEIHEATPSDPLRRAIDRLRESIEALRALGAAQRSMHEQLVIDAEGVISSSGAGAGAAPR